jgi:tight adherence protein B
MQPVGATAPLAAATNIIFWILPIVGSMLLTYGIFQVLVESRATQRKRLKDRLKGETAAGRQEKELNSILRRGAMRKDESFAHALFGRLSFLPKLQTTLDQADLPWSAAQTLLNLCAGGLMAAVVLFMLQVNPLAAAGCGVAVVILPLGAINFLRKRRMSKLGGQLPDVFEMMSQALRAGQSLAGAIQIVHEQLPPPVSTEFGLVYQEQNLGVKVEDALLSMANRVDSMDVRFFVTAVMIQRQTGGDLAEVLDNISNVIRERIELQGMVKGLTAEGRLSGYVLFALPFLVFAAVNMLNPEYSARLFTDPLGRVMLIVAGGMQLMGLAMIRWIVNIKI